MMIILKFVGTIVFLALAWTALVYAAVDGEELFRIDTD